MKIQILGPLTEDSDAGYSFPMTLEVGKGIYRKTKTIRLSLGKSEYNPDDQAPQYLTSLSNNPPNGFWAFRGKTVLVSEADHASQEELLLRIKHRLLREEKVLHRIKREVEAFENMEHLPVARRERIPESVRLFVWQRDEGKCAKCGSREQLEFDHIIPLVLGGSNTERNIQLLCQRCNREKAKNI